MKKNNFLLIALLLLSLAVVFAGCSSGGSSDSTPVDTGGGDTGGGTGTAITTNDEGQQAASAGAQSGALANGSADTFGNLSNLGLSSTGSAVPVFKSSKSVSQSKGVQITSRLAGKFAGSNTVRTAAASVRHAVAMNAIQTIPSTTSQCTDGGSVTFSGSMDDVSGDYTLTFQFANCREDSEQYDGSYTLSGTATSSTITLTGFTIFEYDYLGNLIYSTTADVTMAVSVSGGALNGSFVSTINGTLTAYDYFMGETYTITYANFAETVTFTTGASETWTYTINGSVNEAWGGNAVAVTYTNLNLTVVFAASYDDMSLSGSISINFTPDDCFEGTYVYVTNTPLRWDYNLGHYIAGQLVINGTTTITYNADGTVTVTVTGNTPQTYNSLSELYVLCDFATLDDEGGTTSGGSTGTTTGSAMTITLTWGNVTDMDLHMNYYSTTAPTGTTAGTSYVDWHNHPVDLNGDGSTDADLDYDYTVEGYGPEHITTTSLPTGYYVISVNSFDLYSETSATVNVTIQIGSTTYGPYTNIFGTSDYEGQSAGAWFPVADIVVDGSGSVLVQGHDGALQPWHDGAFGMAPAVRPAKAIR